MDGSESQALPWELSEGAVGGDGETLRAAEKRGAGQEGRGYPPETCKPNFIMKAKGAMQVFIHDLTFGESVAGHGIGLIQGHGKKGGVEMKDLASRRKW